MFLYCQRKFKIEVYSSESTLCNHHISIAVSEPWLTPVNDSILMFWNIFDTHKHTVLMFLLSGSISSAKS